jgi:hypothetical protein
MSRPGLVPHDRLGLSPTQLEARQFAPRHLPCLAASSRDTVTESALEIACNLLGNDRHGAMVTIGATGALAVSDPLKLVDWASAKWGE